MEVDIMLLNKTECKCGKELKEVRFDRYEPNHDREFYGGRVHMTGTYKCECGRELKGYFSRNMSGELDLIDLEVLEELEEEIIEEIIEETPEEVVIEETPEEVATDINVAHKETKTSKKKK